MNRYEYPAGSTQKLVVFYSEDTGGEIDMGGLFTAIADDAAEHEADGWRIVSSFGLPLRQLGTAGNIVFQSGGQYTTQVGVAVVYAKA